MSSASGSDELRGACPSMLCKGSCVHSDDVHAHAFGGRRSCASASMWTARRRFLPGLCLGIGYALSGF